MLSLLPHRKSAEVRARRAVSGGLSRAAGQEFISGWMKGAPNDEIAFENVIEFLSWALFGKDVRHIQSCERTELVRALPRVALMRADPLRRRR